MKKPDSYGDILWRSVLKPRRPVPRSDRFQRYRGVLLVATVPVLLIVAVIMLVPRSGSLYPMERTHTLTELRHKTGSRYCIVFDAGSTGSRVHVFQFEPDPSDAHSLRLLKDTFQQLKPGLSSYADDPAAAVKSLQPLLDTALKTVPAELQAATPIMLKATAGLRLLPGTKAEQILQAVTKALRATPFKLPEDGVGILDGQDEGGFAWLTLNYLLGRLKGDGEHTVAAIDLGGGSVQEAFAVMPDDAKAAPKGYILELKAAGHIFYVYVHSYLGYGLMAGRAKLAAAVASSKSTEPGCFSKDFKGVYKYAGQDINILADRVAGGSFGSCSSLAAFALNSTLPCGAPQPHCSFNGAWRGERVPDRASKASRLYYVSSYFWDRAIESDIITDKNARVWPTTPKEFAKKATDVCSLKDGLALTDKYGKVLKEADIPYLCLDLSYAHVLLTKGFLLKETESVTLVKQVQYEGQYIEAAWPLGAALNSMSV